MPICRRACVRFVSEVVHNLSRVKWEAHCAFQRNAFRGYVLQTMIRSASGHRSTYLPIEDIIVESEVTPLL